MEEAVIATFNDVKFIEGETFLTQENWQGYFAPTIKNGVYEGLEPRNYLGSTTYTNGRIFVTDGIVFANGICAKIETADGYTDFGTCPTTGTHDRLICVRVYFDSQTAQLIQKTNVMKIPEGGTNYKYYSAYAIRTFAHDESYKMDRNNTYWDIPIFYQGTQDLEWTSKGIDLRRIINKEQEIDPVDTCFKGYSPRKYKVSGNNVYHVTAELGNVSYCFVFDIINKPDGATIVLDRPINTFTPADTTSIIFTLIGATNNYLASDDFGAASFQPTTNSNYPIGSNWVYKFEITHTGLTFIKINYAGTKGEMSGYDYRNFYPFKYYIEKFEAL